MSTDFFPSSSVGVLKADAPDLVMVNLGIDPKTSQQPEWDQAAEWLTKLRDSDTFYAAYDQGYVDDLTAKNLSGTMAWSGDVLYYKIWDGKPLEFIVPADGALLWIDNMLIPANSANPAGALEMMDFYYKPEIAQMVTEYVLYMSPVPAVQDLIAAAREGQETGDSTRCSSTRRPRTRCCGPTRRCCSQVSLGRQPHHATTSRRPGTTRSTRSGSSRQREPSRPTRPTGSSPRGWTLPPAREGERALARRRRTAAYLHARPGGFYLIIGFVVPLIIIVITSLSTRRPVLDRRQVDLLVGVVATTPTAHPASTGESIFARSMYAGDRDDDLHRARLPDGVLDRVLRRASGRRRCSC